MSAANLKDLKLKRLEITGDVTIREFSQDEWDLVKLPTIIMGPTGAGKSSLYQFIEALAGPNSSVKNLSSAGLEGYTQNVTAYRVKGLANSVYSTDIFLMDTPGFADDKISLMEIISMVQKSLRVGGTVLHILYVMPITNTRLSGSQRKVLEAFKAITGRDASGGITIVTTMWDTIHNVQAQARAQRNFEQLRNDIWKDFADRVGYATYSTEITKFVNTQASAIEILDLVYQRTRYKEFYVTTQISDKLSQRHFSPTIYRDLIERIESLKLRKDNILSDLATLPSGSDDGEITTILNLDLERVVKLLAKFEKQLEEFGVPSVPYGTFASTPHPPKSNSNGRAEFGAPSPPTSHLSSVEPTLPIPPPTPHINARDVYTSFISQIEALQMRKDVIGSELARLSTSETEAIDILTGELNQFTDALSGFENQLQQLRRPHGLRVMADRYGSTQAPSASMPLAARRQENKKGLLTGLKESTKQFVEKLKVTRPDYPGY